MGASVVTPEDLMEFKNQLLADFEALMVEHTHPQPRNWVRSGELMERLGISHSTLHNLRNKNIIPSYRVEGLIFYDIIEVDRILMTYKVDLEDTP